jgi:hypothetical protein
MFGRVKFRQAILCLGLQLIAMFGVPVKAEDVEDLLRKGQQIRIESEDHRSDDSGEP